MLKNSVIVIFMHSLSFILYGQRIPQDSAFVKVAAKNTLSSYSKVFEFYTPLYSGSEYIKYSSLRNEHPYFLDDDFTVERIQYLGHEYEEVDLLYDLVHDEVIFYGGKMIKLVPENINYFTRLGHLFIRLDDPGIPTGFYDLLYTGEIKVLVKRSKILFEEKRSDKQIIREFKEQNKYYIFKSGMYHSVKSKKSLLQLFGNKKQEIAQYMRQNNILFNQDRERAIVKITEYYCTISSQ